MLLEKREFKMGMNWMRSSSSYDGCESFLPNPDPKNYSIMCYEQWRDNLVVRIIYHDCTNYEGEKILVFKGTNIQELKRQKLIDPHFSENKDYLSPIARFEPTRRGWVWAEEFAKGLK